MTLRQKAALAALVTALALPGCAGGDRGSAAPPATAGLADVSGLAWVQDTTFLVVHDAKADGLPRASLVSLPASAAGPGVQALTVAWPQPHPPASDLESIARIPGTASFLLAESGSARRAGTPLQRLFLADYNDGRLAITQVVNWPVPVENVEGTAVARIGERLVFLFAERAEGQPQTLLRWAEMTLQPLAFGPFREVAFAAPAPTGRYARPVSAIDIDDAGRIYVAAAIDTGNDHGPFRSVIWRIGRIEADAAGQPAVVLDAQPVRLATLDGVKVEGIAVRPQPGGAPELFFGTDDERHGGIVRRVPAEGV